MQYSPKVDPSFSRVLSLEAPLTSTETKGAWGKINPQGNPPALPEDSRSLTAPRVASSLRDVNLSKFTKVDGDESIRITQAYNLGVQVSCGVYTGVPEESALWAIEARAWGVISGTSWRRESEIIEGHLMPDHVHMMISVPPK